MGLMYLSGMLSRNLIKNELIDLAFYDKSHWRSVIASTKADLYGLTVYSSSFNEAKEIAKIIKEFHPKSKIVFGGPHPTFAYLCFTEVPELDFIIFGEGEETLLELCQKFDNPFSYNEITGLANRQGMNGEAWFIGNPRKQSVLDSLAFPNRNILPLKMYTRKVDGKLSTPFMTSRGCAYACNFCCSNMFWGKPRYHSVERIKQELVQIYNLGFEAVHCWDDTFTLNENLKTIVEYMKSLNFVYRCNGNLRTDTKDTLQLLHDTGCREYCVGIESGDQKVLNLINKGTTVKRNMQVMDWAKEVGLPVKAYIMVGNPGETWESIEKTVDFIKATNPEYYTLSSLTPLPGSRFYHQADRFKIKFRTQDWNEYFNIGRQNEGGKTHDTEFLSAEEIAEARKYLISVLPKQSGKLQDYYKRL